MSGKWFDERDIKAFNMMMGAASNGCLPPYTVEFSIYIGTQEEDWDGGYDDHITAIMLTQHGRPDDKEYVSTKYPFILAVEDIIEQMNAAEKLKDAKA